MSDNKIPYLSAIKSEKVHFYEVTQAKINVFFYFSNGVAQKDLLIEGNFLKKLILSFEGNRATTLVCTFDIALFSIFRAL